MHAGHLSMVLVRKGALGIVMVREGAPSTSLFTQTKNVDADRSLRPGLTRVSA